MRYKRNQYRHKSNNRYEKIPRSSSENPLISKVLIPLIIGLIGVFGTISGVYITYSLSSKESEKARIIEYEATIVNQRIEIIDRASRIYGKAPGISDLWAKYLSEVGNSTVEIELAEKLAEYNGEYESVVWMAGLYFGPKTKEALKVLSDERGPWWTKNPENVDKFMIAMYSEIDYGIKYFSTASKSEK